MRVIHELVRRVITRFVNDVFAKSQARLAALEPASIDDIAQAGHAVVALSREFALAQMDIKEFLFARMYRHRAILPVWKHAGRIVRGLFDFFMREPDAMAVEWAEAASGADEAARARMVADYIAGMTDRYALAQAEKWLEPEAASRARIDRALEMRQKRGSLYHSRGRKCLNLCASALPVWEPLAPPSSAC